MDFKHRCPFCGKEHDREAVPDPISKPCPECWVNNEHSIIALKKEEWATILDWLETLREPTVPWMHGDECEELGKLMQRMFKQAYPPTDETIEVSERRKSNEGSKKERRL